MQHTAKPLAVYAIPGQNGLGSEQDYVANLLGCPEEAVTMVETPKTFPDLGQSNCIYYLRKALAQKDPGQPVIIHATSQGTATILNFLAQEGHDKNIKALILEATLATGNNAVVHTLKNPYSGLAHLTHYPWAYYWLPYAAKGMFPCYWPGGKQAITALHKLPKNIPIIIAHSRKDIQLAYEDACALYYGLRARGNDNVYFISKDGNKHLQILNTVQDSSDVRNILAKHKIPSFSANGNSLAGLQPDPEQFKPLYENLIRKERNHTRIGYSFGFATVAAIGAVIRKITGWF